MAKEENFMAEPQMEETGIVMSIDSVAFAEIKLSFDRVLAAVLKKMRIRDSDQAKITMDVSISLQNVKTTDLKTGEILNVKNPEIKYKINHKLEYKSNEDKEEGVIQQADSFLACVNGEWVIKPIEDGQMTINEYIKGRNKR